MEKTELEIKASSLELKVTHGKGMGSETCVYYLQGYSMETSLHTCVLYT